MSTKFARKKRYAFRILSTNNVERDRVVKGTFIGTTLARLAARDVACSENTSTIQHSVSPGTHCAEARAIESSSVLVELRDNTEVAKVKITLQTAKICPARRLIETCAPLAAAAGEMPPVASPLSIRCAQILA